MENFFSNIKKTSHQEKALNQFLALELMNKSRYAEVMGYINSMVNNNEPAGKKISELAHISGESLHFYMKNFGTVNTKTGTNFMEEIEYGHSESIFKKFKKENLTNIEQELYDLRKGWHEIKSKVKEHADKLKLNIITKEPKNSIPAIKKIYPEGIAKDSITEVLLEQTIILKDEYLQHTKDHAEKSFNKYKNITLMTREDLIKEYPRTVINFRKHEEVILSKKGLDLLNTSLSIVREGEEKYITNKIYTAEMHYYDSIRRLVNRLNTKGIIQASDFEIETAKIGINIETLIRHKDGKITKAWTIIAYGDIIAPHYRYLVK